jgi:HTH-type transcriptional regulator/antitoxin HigA
LRHEVAEYEALKTHQVSALELHSLSELPDLLIKARIARGYTQADLAKRLHLKPQQLQRYEATRYHSVSFRRLLERYIRVTGSQHKNRHRLSLGR